MTVFGDTVLAGVFASSVLLAAFLNFEFVKKPDKTPHKEPEEFVFGNQYTVYGDPMKDEFDIMLRKREEQKQLRAEEAEKRALDFERQQREILGESKRIADEDAKRIELRKEIDRNKPFPNTGKKSPPPRTPPPQPPPRTPLPPLKDPTEYFTVFQLIQIILTKLSALSEKIKDENYENGIKKLNELYNSYSKTNDFKSIDTDSKFKDTITTILEKDYNEDVTSMLWILLFIIKDPRDSQELLNKESSNYTFRLEIIKGGNDNSKFKIQNIEVDRKLPNWNNNNDEELNKLVEEVQIGYKLSWANSIKNGVLINNYDSISNFMSNRGTLLIVPKLNGFKRDIFQYLRAIDVDIKHKLDLMKIIIFWSEVSGDDKVQFHTDGRDVPWLHVRLKPNDKIRNHFNELNSISGTGSSGGGSSSGNYAVSVLGVTTLIITAFAASVVQK
jgi:hypothetical protein